MAGYLKKIAIIRQLKGGFSANGENLSGLVKAQTYAGFLKVEASLINFAPLTEGKYLLGITDGLKSVIFEGLSYEGEQDFNLSSGFAFLVCFCHGKTYPIASAACGQMACALPDLKEEMEKAEAPAVQKSGGAAYDDEAITEVNYFENDAGEGGDAVLKGEAEEKECGHERDEDEAHTGAVEGEKECGVNGLEGGLAGGDYYSRVEGDVERIFATFPRQVSIEKVMQNSRFARIDYGDGKHYVFGVLNIEGRPRYLCYGVPAHGKSVPPKSLQGCATLVPTEDGGYFMTYQDAATGISVRLALD